MTQASNIFGDFRRLVVAALDRLAGEGALPSGLDFSRVAVEPPRDPSHGDLATNAAMVLAGAVKQNPMALAERIAAALGEQELVSGDYRAGGFAVTAARPGFRRDGLWRFDGRRRREGQCRVCLGQPDRADACRPWPRRRRRRRARGIARQGWLCGAP